MVAAGHQLSLDWTQESETTFVSNYASDLDLSAKIAADDLDAVLDADAVLVVASQHEGRGMFVELGAALSRASRGDLEHVVVVGPIQHERLLLPLLGPARSTVADWFNSLQ